MRERSCPMANGVWVWVCGSLTFGEVIDANVVKLLDLFHDQLLLVDLDHHRGMPSISPGESELAEGGLELLRNVDGTGLCSMERVEGIAGHIEGHRNGVFRTRMGRYGGKEPTMKMA